MCLYLKPGLQTRGGHTYPQGQLQFPSKMLCFGGANCCLLFGSTRLQNKSITIVSNCTSNSTAPGQRGVRGLPLPLYYSLDLTTPTDSDSARAEAKAAEQK